MSCHKNENKNKNKSPRPYFFTRLQQEAQEFLGLIVAFLSLTILDHWHASTVYMYLELITEIDARGVQYCSFFNDRSLDNLADDESAAPSAK